MRVAGVDVAGLDDLGYNAITDGKVMSGPPTTIYVRAQTSQVAAVQGVLGQTVSVYSDRAKAPKHY